MSHCNASTKVAYDDFLRAKVVLAEKEGFDCDADEVNPLLKPHQRQIVQWMVAGGKRACFAAFGLGKSVIQLETVRITTKKCSGRALLKGRKGYGVELNPGYFADGVAYCKAAENQMSMPSLFDFEEMDSMQLAEAA